MRNRILEIGRDPFWQSVGVVIAVVGIVIGVITSGGSGDTIQLTPSTTPTPSTTQFNALQNIYILEGPGTSFNRIAMLSAGNHLDILGISEDDRWYQVLLPDGNTGWVAKASSAGEVSGPLDILTVVMQTSVPSLTQAITPTTTNTRTPTLTTADTTAATNIATSIATMIHPPPETATPANSPDSPILPTSNPVAGIPSKSTIDMPQNSSTFEPPSETGMTHPAQNTELQSELYWGSGTGDHFEIVSGGDDKIDDVRIRVSVASDGSFVGTMLWDSSGPVGTKNVKIRGVLYTSLDRIPESASSMLTNLPDIPDAASWLTWGIDEVSGGKSVIAVIALSGELHGIVYDDVTDTPIWRFSSPRR